MKRLFNLLLIFCALGNICYANDVNFIQVTDVHFTKSKTEYLKQFVDEINDSQLKKVDFIVFTGDNLDKANPQDLFLFLDIIKELKPKTYVLPGNHDLYSSRNMTKNNYMYLVKKKLGIYHSNKPNYVIKKGDLVFVTMNGVKQVIPGPNGYYKNEELMWLDKTLTKYANKRVVIFQHFPLLATNVRSHKLYRKEDYEQVLKKHNNVIKSAGII